MTDALLCATVGRPCVPQQRKYDVDESDRLRMLASGAGAIRPNGSENASPALSGQKKKAPTASEKKLAEAAKKKGQKSILGMFMRAPGAKKAKTGK